VFLVAAGTATIELAARGIPMVVAYRAHPVTWEVGRRLVRVRHLALPNILAGRGIVPEHLQELDPQAIAEDLLRVAGDQGLGAELRAVADTLEGERAVVRIAGELVATFRGPSR
jgi:lipid-A-disaccharide synthase